MLSLVVIAKNEAEHIGACLSSVPFADELLVLDSGSSDDTVAIAKAAGARVVVTDWPGHVAQKNRAMEMAQHPWVISLDADERLSPDAAAQLQQALKNPGNAAGFSFPRCSEWLGRPIRHGKWYPDRKLRAVRRDLAKWIGDDPHDHLHVDGPVTRLAGDILHVPYKDFAEHLKTIDAYTAIHAKSLAARGVKAHVWDLLLRPPAHFVDGYVVRRGFLDGGPGVAVAGLGAAHTFLKWWRLWQLDR